MWMSFASEIKMDARQRQGKGSRVAGRSANLLASFGSATDTKCCGSRKVEEEGDGWPVSPADVIARTCASNAGI